MPPFMMTSVMPGRLKTLSASASTAKAGGSAAVLAVVGQRRTEADYRVGGEEARAAAGGQDGDFALAGYDGQFNAALDLLVDFFYLALDGLVRSRAELAKFKIPFGVPEVRNAVEFEHGVKRHNPAVLCEDEGVDFKIFRVLCPETLDEFADEFADLLDVFFETGLLDELRQIGLLVGHNVEFLDVCFPYALDVDAADLRREEQHQTAAGLG